MSREELVYEISRCGQGLMELKQVKKSLHKLLPTRFAQIAKNYRQNNKATKAARLALVDPQYLSYVEELAHISLLHQQARIRWETYQLFYVSRFYRR